MTTAPEVRLGRNYVRAGDAVRVTPSAAGRRDGFIGNVRLIRVDDDGVATHIDVFDPRGALRTLPLERIRRVAQTRVERRAR